MNNVDRPSYRYVVRQIQTFLNRISRIDRDIPPVNPDGIYGSTTIASVTAFQKKYGLRANGKVDYLTWQLILREYRIADQILSAPKMISPFSEPLKNNVLEKGDRSDLVMMIKDILRVISVSYQTDAIPYNNVFDAQTEKAITEFQKINGLKSDGKIDILTWNSLADAYNKYILPL